MSENTNTSLYWNDRIGLLSMTPIRTHDSLQNDIWPFQSASSGTRTTAVLNTWLHCNTWLTLWNGHGYI